MKSSSSVGPALIPLVFLVAASVTYVWIRRPASAVENPIVVLPDQRIELRRPEYPTAPPLEPAPGPPVVTPSLPDASADKLEMWQFGERYLGWESLAQVNLDQFSDADLRTWLEQDHELYNHGLPLGYAMGTDE